MKFTNTQNISLPLAVWLLHDTYKHNSDPKHFSATTLMKPVRQVILNRRMSLVETEVDISTMIASKLGTSIHAGIEDAWLSDYREAMEQLCITEETIDKVRINPNSIEAVGDIIPVYLEQRYSRWLNGFHISGQVDMIVDGILQDYKSTSTYTYTHNTREEEHRLQGSIYRWLEPNKITSNHIGINYIFMDWHHYRAASDSDYPQSRLLSKDIELMSLKDTEEWITNKLEQIAKFTDADEADIPHCTNEELWIAPPQFRYYSNPANTSGRSTKNFDNIGDALTMQESKGKGVVITKLGVPKRCNYCSCYQICTQKDTYFPPASTQLY